MTLYFDTRGRRALKYRIWTQEHGGWVIPNKPSSGQFNGDPKRPEKEYIVLVEHHELPAMTKEYEWSRNVWAEMWTYVDHCIREQSYAHPDGEIFR